MIGNAEFGEGLQSPPLIDLAKRSHERSSLPGEIRIRGEQIGAGKWKEMLDLTDEDGKEREVIMR